MNSKKDKVNMEPIGASSAFTRAHRLAVKAARTDVPVLILGESGTGKEIYARQLHELGPRRMKPYVALNCGALSETMLESEFFGHVRGAFTGAHRTRKGRLEEADGGTVFLDEVAEMSPACQVKLLRTLDTGEITPVGGNVTKKIDIRVIAATNRNLEEMIQSGEFREDLFYRLQGMMIELPPLRKRRGDMEMLARHFLREEAARQESAVVDFTPEAVKLMREHPWPGNVRELKQAVARAVAMAESELIRPEDLPNSVRKPSAPESEPIPALTVADEKSRIIAALKETAYPGTGRWNIQAAARQLKMNHQTLRYKIRKVYRLIQND